MFFSDCIAKALEKRKLGTEDLQVIHKDKHNIVSSVLEFATGEEGGQLRADCKLRRFNLAAFRLGTALNNLTEEERKSLKGKSVQNIHLGGHIESYTIVGKYYLSL